MSVAEDLSQEPAVVEWRPNGLVLIPGLSFEEWQAEWEKADQVSRSINWTLGDLLLYGEDNFPDTWPQVTTPEYAEKHRGLLRVSRAIPMRMRRESLSWSVHREVCRFLADERDAILDEAERGKWTARDISELWKKRKHNGNAAPEPAPALLAASIPGDEPEPPDDKQDEGPHVTIIEGSTLGNGESPYLSNDRASDIRACLEALRGFIAERQTPESVANLNIQIADVTGRRRYSLDWVRNSDHAISLIPDEWLVGIKIEGGEYVFGGRKWSVELRKGQKLAIGLGSQLAPAICEAALSILLSDTG